MTEVEQALDVEQALLAEQRADGAFRAQVELRGRLADDHNTFVTAQVVRALCDPLSPRLAAARARALDYLERARAPSGSCNHWPSAEQPRWFPPPPRRRG